MFASTGSDTLEDVHVQASSEKREGEREKGSEKTEKTTTATATQMLLLAVSTWGFA